MRVAYIRVSTAEQNEARQLEAMKNLEIEKYYTEKVSGKTLQIEVSLSLCWILSERVMKFMF